MQRRRHSCLQRNQSETGTPCFPDHSSLGQALPETGFCPSPTPLFVEEETTAADAILALYAGLSMAFPSHEQGTLPGDVGEVRSHRQDAFYRSRHAESALAHDGEQVRWQTVLVVIEATKIDQLL